MAQRVTSIELEHFDPRVLALYWSFLTERQRIWLRRSRGQDKPWTADPILQVEFITNVYRQLDPGTEYLINAILSSPLASDEAKVFNVMLYRLMGSKPDTHQHIGFLDPANYTPAEVIGRLAELPDDYKIFGDAYRVASYTDEGGTNKAENVANMFGYLAGGMEETVRRIKSSRRVVEVYKVFETMQGFGEFLSHQIVVDLLYANLDGEKIVPFGDDEFAKPGPGCRKGIWAMMSEEYKPANLTIVLEWLRDHQQEALGPDFPYLLNSDSTPHLMSICDIQASLCEFYKYYRLWSGERAVQVRKYDGPHREVLRRPTTLTDEQATWVCALEVAATGTEDDTSVAEVSGQIDEVEDDDYDEVSPQREEGMEESSGTQVISIPDGDGGVMNIYISINIFTGKSGDNASG